MSFGTAQRGTMHAMGTTDAVFVPRYRVTSPLVVAKGLDGLNRHCYRGDLLSYLNPEQEAHFLRLGLVERIDADPQEPIVAAADAPAEPVDLDADEDTLDTATADSGAVDECVATLARLQVPTTAGAPAARSALRGNGFRFGNAVVAAAVKSRKLSGTATDADDEEFESVVM
jgi:hypothetical protein